MKKYQYTYKDRYFNTMIIGNKVIRINPKQDSGEKIYKMHLEKHGVLGEEYVSFLTSSIGTVLADKSIVCMEFIKIFVDGQQSFETEYKIITNCLKQIKVSLIYGEK